MVWYMGPVKAFLSTRTEVTSPLHGLASLCLFWLKLELLAGQLPNENYPKKSWVAILRQIVSVKQHWEQIFGVMTSVLIQGHHLTSLHVTDLMETGYGHHCEVAASDLGSKGTLYLLFIVKRKRPDTFHSVCVCSRQAECQPPGGRKHLRPVGNGCLFILYQN